MLEQRAAGNSDLVGMMLESNLSEGKQTIPADLKDLQVGVSLTDSCVGWEATEGLLQESYDMLGATEKVLAGR